MWHLPHYQIAVLIVRCGRCIDTQYVALSCNNTRYHQWGSRQIKIIIYNNQLKKSSGSALHWGVAGLGV